MMKSVFLQTDGCQMRSVLQTAEYAHRKRRAGDRLSEIRILVLAAVLLGGVADTAFCDNTGSQFAVEQFVEDSKVKENVLRVANAYVAKQVKAVGYLAVKDASVNTERRFTVVQVFDVVSMSGEVYTVQIDADEMDGEPRYLLFLDLKEAAGELNILGIRIGSRHLRQSSQ